MSLLSETNSTVVSGNQLVGEDLVCTSVSAAEVDVSRRHGYSNRKLWECHHNYRHSHRCDQRRRTCVFVRLWRQPLGTGVGVRLGVHHPKRHSK